MAIANHPDQQQEFVPTSELEVDETGASKVPLDKRTTYVVRQLSQRERLRVLLDSVGTQWEKVYDTVLATLKGFRNLKFADGADATFEVEKGKRSPLGRSLEGVPTDRTIDQIPHDHFTEIANFAVQSGELSEDDQKN